MNEEGTVVKAAKFLKLLQEEAMNKVRLVIKPKDNSFNVEGFYFVDGFQMGGTKSNYHIKAKLNGKEYILEGEIEAVSTINRKEETVIRIYDAILKQVSEIIATELKTAFDIVDYKRERNLATVL